MSRDKLLDVLNDINEELGINPLFEFITVITIVISKIEREQEKIKKNNNVSTEHLENLISLYTKLKEYIDKNNYLFLSASVKKIYKKCKMENFADLDNKIKLIKDKNIATSFAELNNLYNCLKETLQTIKKYIMNVIKKEPKKTTDIINTIATKPFEEMVKETTEETTEETIEETTEKTTEDKPIETTETVDELFDKIKKIYNEINTMEDEINKIYNEKIEKNKEDFNREIIKIDFKNKDASIKILKDIEKIIEELQIVKTNLEKEEKSNKINEYEKEATEIIDKAYKYYSSTDKIKLINGYFKQIEKRKTDGIILKIIIDDIKVINEINDTYNNKIKEIDDKIKKILNVIINSGENDFTQFNMLYSLQLVTIQYILNTFTKLLGEKLPSDLKKLIKNLFVYLRVNKGFRYNGALGRGQGKDNDFTLNELIEYKVGSSGLIGSHTYIDNPIINTDKNLKVIQLFKIAIVKIAINIYNNISKTSSEQEDTKVFEIITKDFDILRKKIYEYKFGELEYYNAIKDNSGFKLYIDIDSDIPTLQGGNNFFFKYIKYKNKYLKLKYNI